MDTIQEERSLDSETIQLPLVLDLDHTLIKTDLFFEALVLFLKANPLNIFVVFIWLLRGRAFLKRQLAHSVELTID
ncbi:hypothetical protein [Pseudovibrio sp. Tun.PSC04-5.I4]|uniref:hypothetical protein n=1 Tax=Pseudovibrio sp. Tun.PSC04-5.I4 TaxID=1798213 RepID=UPI000B85F190|nr:hypothetical protein [Pseudovibrio sp. Tun.PSC04-5.I4]